MSNNNAPFRRVTWISAGGAALVGDAPMVNGTTYFGEFRDWHELITSLFLEWDAAIAVTSFTFYSTNDPTVAVESTAARDWFLEPSIVLAGFAAGAAGCATVHVNGCGATRLRVRVVVGATGGDLQGRGAGVQG